jgi:hypothetical protein
MGVGFTDGFVPMLWIETFVASRSRSVPTEDRQFVSIAAAAVMQIRQVPPRVWCQMSPSGEYVLVESVPEVGQAGFEAAVQSGAAQQPEEQQARAEVAARSGAARPADGRRESKSRHGRSRSSSHKSDSSGDSGRSKVSSRDSAKSRASEESVQRRSNRDAMTQAGAPVKVAELFVRLRKPLSALSLGVSYVVKVSGFYSLDLVEDDMDMLNYFFPDTAPSAVRYLRDSRAQALLRQAVQTPPQRVPAEQTPAPGAPPRVVGGNGVPQVEQLPAQRTLAEQTPAIYAPPQTAPPAPRQAPQTRQKTQQARARAPKSVNDQARALEKEQLKKQQRRQAQAEQATAEAAEQEEAAEAARCTQEEVAAAAAARSRQEQVAKKRRRQAQAAEAEAKAAAESEAALQEAVGQAARNEYECAAAAAYGDAEQEVPMTQAERADAAEIREVVEIVRGDVELCVRNVHDRDLREVLTNIALTFAETTQLVQNPNWMPEAVLPAIKVAITSASQATEVSLTEQLLRHGTVEQTSAKRIHVFMALTEMAGALTASRTMGSRSGGRGASTSDTRVNAAVLLAAEKLDAQAGSTVDELQRLAQASGTRVEQNGPELRAAVAAAQQGEFGAEIALIIHQESLATPKGTMAPSANKMWNSLLVVAQRQRDALVSYFRRLTPLGVDIKLLVTAIVCGKLTVADMVPPAVTKAGKAPEVREAVMRAWPLVMQIMLEVHPRDVTAQYVLLKLALDVFAREHVASNPVETLLKPVLEEMRTTSALYLMDGGAEHSWQETMDNSMADALQSMALRGSLAGAAQAASGQQQSQPQPQARAAEEAATAAERKRLAEAAGDQPARAAEEAATAAERERLAEAACDQPASTEPATRWVGAAQWAAMTPSERYEVHAERDAVRGAAAKGLAGSE